MSGETFPDVEGAVRDYLRGDDAVAPVFGSRVFFGVSGDVWPQAIVRRVGGGDDTSEVPLDIALVQVDVWGPLRNKALTTDAKNVVRSALHGIRSLTRPAEDEPTVLHGATVISDVWLPDPATDRPRYALTVEVTARTTIAA